jgi:hypothetical protein
LASGVVGSVLADPFSFSTGNVDGRMAMSSRPASLGVTEVEAADDFVTATAVSVNHLTFTGLIPSNASLGSITDVQLEIYRVFPKDSVNPPSGNVPTRINSPSDVAFASRSLGASDFTLSSSLLANSFTSANSIQAGSIHPIPNQTTGGNGAVTGQEVLFDIALTLNLELPADHYFFVPLVKLSSGDFYWLSSTRPIIAPGTPFAPDLQAWIREESLAPDWLRVGSDIVGGSSFPTFNGAFSLDGETVPEGSTVVAGLMLGGLLLWRKMRSQG